MPSLLFGAGNVVNNACPCVIAGGAFRSVRPAGDRVRAHEQRRQSADTVFETAREGAEHGEDDDSHRGKGAALPSGKRPSGASGRWTSGVKICECCVGGGAEDTMLNAEPTDRFEGHRALA